MRTNDGKEVCFGICSYSSSASLKILEKKRRRFPFLFSGCCFYLSKISIHKKIKNTCGKVRNNPLRQRGKGRYRNASLTVEAAVAFPVFFFAVLYLIQMFSVLRAELTIAEAGITSAREVAAFAYAAERMTEGEIAAADKLLELFDQKIVRDATMTAVFYANCDREVLEEGTVAQGAGGIWVSTEDKTDKTEAEIYYRVKPRNVWREEAGRYYVMRLVYRPWIGEGGTEGSAAESTESGEIVYMTEHGSVYHTNPYCTYIKIDVTPVDVCEVEYKRNSSGAKYYGCEFCSFAFATDTVYITEYGTRYHTVSSCSAIARNVREVSLEEVKESYRICSKCEKKKGE